MASMAQVEALATALYESSTTNDQRSEAERQLSVFSTDPTMLEQSRMILDQSNQPYALHLAASSLQKLMTSHWGRFSTQQRSDLRNHLLTLLAQKGPSMQVFVTVALVTLLARITKLGWSDPVSRPINRRHAIFCWLYAYDSGMGALPHPKRP